MTTLNTIYSYYGTLGEHEVPWEQDCCISWRHFSFLSTSSD